MYKVVIYTPKLPDLDGIIHYVAGVHSRYDTEAEAREQLTKLRLAEDQLVEVVEYKN